MQKFKSVEELINQLKPEKPVYCIRKKSIESSVKFFLDKFPGKILYAVKTNPHPEVIQTILNNGVNQFDVASIEEIKAIRKITQNAKCSYMHTVKSRESIKEAYFNYGVKTFSLDTKEELIKIIESTNNAKDLELFVRVAVSNEHAEIDLSKKFGALTSEAVGLLRLVKQYAKKIGLSFHVGSQCMHPISYAKGINEIGNIIKKTKIIPDTINVGGGFPTIYPDLIPQSLRFCSLVRSSSLFGNVAPSNSIEPVIGGNKPVMTRAVVDFPDPDSPTTATVEPRGTEMFTLFRIFTLL